MFHKIDIILSNFSFSKTDWKLTDKRFNGFITSSLGVHNFMKHADDVSKLACFKIQAAYAIVKNLINF